MRIKNTTKFTLDYDYISISFLHHPAASLPIQQHDTHPHSIFYNNPITSMLHKKRKKKIKIRHKK